MRTVLLVPSRGSRKTPQLNYNHLHYFHVAAVEGSVGAAAQYLGVTQPTISEQLRTLERALGVALFERQPSGLKLTDAGRLTFKHTSIMFSAGARLAEELDHGSQPQAHILRVGITATTARLAAGLLTPMLEVPGCVPAIRIAEHVEILRELRVGSLDLAVTDTEPPKAERRGLEVVELQRVQLSLVARTGVEPSPDWRNVQLLHYRLGAQLRWDVDNFLATRNIEPTVAAETDDPVLLVEAVGKGAYVAIVPHILVSESIAAGRLREIERIESAHVCLHGVHRSGAEIAMKVMQRLSTHYRVGA